MNKKNTYTDAQTLVKCPNSKSVGVYSVKAGTTSIAGSAFVNNKTITELGCVRLDDFQEFYVE